MNHLALGAAVCGALLSSSVASQQAGAPAAARPSFAVDHRAFAVDLHRVLAREHPDRNLAFSPLSVRAALALLRAGATGETRAEIDRVLRFSGDDRAIAAAYRAFDAALRARQHRSADDLEVMFEFERADAAWVAERLGLKPDYAALLRDAFDAGVAALDFASDPDAARATINGWVADRTAGRIDELLQRGDLGADTALVLTDALRVSGPWAEALRPRGELAFRGPDGAASKVPFVGARRSLRLHRDDALSAVALPIQGGALAMVFVLPAPGSSLAALEAALDADALGAVLDAVVGDDREPVAVDFMVPEFDVRTPVRLDEPLQELGVRRAFGPDAELSGIADGPLFVSLVRHEAFVAVDAAGVEAAAATAVVVKRGGVRPAEVAAEFHADRPFLFALVDRGTGSPLFLGRVVRP